MKIIYVASPYAGDIEKNTEYAKKACLDVMNQGHAFFCPHLLYPNILDENNPSERQLGLNMGLAMLKNCDELWCYGKRISTGMRAEIEEAKRLEIPTLSVMLQEHSYQVGEIERQAPKMEMGTL